MENVSDDDEDNEDFEKRAEHVPEISARGICSGNDSVIIIGCSGAIATNLTVCKNKLKNNRGNRL